MALTRHGHHIPRSTPYFDDPQTPKVDCGGPSVCSECSTDVQTLYAKWDEPDMAHTTHGHHIPGTTLVDLNPEFRAKCGGPNYCTSCSREIATYQLLEVEVTETLDSSVPYMREVPTEYSIGEGTNFPVRVLAVMSQYLKARLPQGDDEPTYEIYIVTFTKTLQHYKAMVATTLPDKMYYEVTHNGDRRETYIDAYRKIENVVIPD